MGVGASAGAGEGVVEAAAAFTDPADATGGNACHEGIIGNIFCHDGSGGDESAATYCVATDDGAVGSKGGAFTDEGVGVDTVDGEVGTGRGDIGEHAGGSAEDVVFYLYAFVDGDVVLDADAVAYLDVVADVDVLAEGAALTEGGTALHMTEVPDFGAGADGYVVVDIAAFVNEIVLHVN